VAGTPIRGRRRRRTQKERREETRALLLDVTVQCLAELGWAGTTTTVVAERAGLSRGAQLHHFGNKPELVVAAMEHLFERRVKEFRDAMTSLPPHTDVASAALDLLWKIFSGPTYYAYMELVVASRTDPEIRDVIVELNRRFDRAVDATFNEFFEQRPENAEVFDVAWTAILALLGGLAFERIVRPADPRIDEVVVLMKRFAPALLAPRHPPHRGST
jgi:AcrR family transcriptional regulator